MTTRLGYLGTFVVGRDPGTSMEIVAVSGPQTPTPLHAVNSSWVAITNWSGDNAVGSFNLLTDDPYSTGVGHSFYGRFKTGFCPTLEGTLLP